MNSSAIKATRPSFYQYNPSLISGEVSSSFGNEGSPVQLQGNKQCVRDQKNQSDVYLRCLVVPPLKEQATPKVKRVPKEVYDSDGVK